MERQWDIVQKIHDGNVGVDARVDRLAIIGSIPSELFVIEIKILALPKQPSPPIKDLEGIDARCSMIAIYSSPVVDVICIGRDHIWDVNGLVRIHNDQH